jgi:hypothetical protein
MIERGTPSIPRPQTREEWQTLLHELLEDRWSYIVDKLGSPAEVIRVIIRDASDPSACRSAFEVALEHLIGMWQPHNPSRSSYYLNMFDILGAFTPSEGAYKLLVQFELVGSWPTDDLSNPGTSSPSSTVEAQSSVEWQALLVLERYFPLPLVSADNHYSLYESLLFSRIDSPYGIYSLRRLLECGAIGVDDSRLISRLKQQPEVLISELMTIVIGTQRSNREPILSALFSQSLQQDLIPQFKQVLARFNCTLSENERMPLLNTPFETLDIRIDEIAFKKYMEMRWSSLSASARAKELVGI